MRAPTPELIDALRHDHDVVEPSRHQQRHAPTWVRIVGWVAAVGIVVAIVWRLMQASD
jgi:hypothetical protein